MDYKTFRLTDVKAAADGWEVAGYASTFDNLDLQGDIVRRGAFAASIADPAQRARVKLLYQHDTAQLLGKLLELREDDAGLYFRARISQTALGADVRQLLLDGVLDSVSIGYTPTVTRGFKPRELLEVELWEVSLVTFPANQQAAVTDVKRQSELDAARAALLAEIAELQPAVDVAALQAQQRALLDEIAEYQPELPDPEELAEQQRALLDEIAAALV